MKVIPVAIVTGASRGIGKHILKKLSSEGLSCIAIASSEESISKINVNDHLYFTREGQRHRSLAIDFAQWPQWASQAIYPGIDHYDNRPGCFSLFDLWTHEGVAYRPNLLVNCAGVSQDSLSIRTTPEAMSNIMKVNFMSSVSLTNLTMKQMIKDRKHQCEISPCIINISSILGISELAVPGTSVYAASKAALSQYTKVLSKEVEPWQIRVSSIAPGLVRGTDMIRELSQDAQYKLQNMISGPNVDSPEQIATQVWDIYKSL